MPKVKLAKINIDHQTPYLYLLIRNDLQSLNPGKAVAHGAHAANQFVYEVREKYEGSRRDHPNYQFYQKWEESADGFGTTIALHVNLDQLHAAVRIAGMLNFNAGITVDPSYPYIVTPEIAGLIDHPEEYPPIYKGEHVVCFREEITAGYVFGDKDELQPLLGRFPLMP